MEINRFIESTNLSPTITGKEVDNLISEAIEYNFLGACVPPFWVERASREIADRDLQLVTVIGFPLGFQMTETKIGEIELALQNGANELDIVMNLSAVNDGMNWAKIELAKCAKVIHEAGAIMKVIVETDLWNEDQLLEVIKIVSDSGADFFKTSTGYHRSPVNIKTVKFIRTHLPSNVGIKASGGISDPQQAKLLIESGADRLGTSKGINLVQ